MLGKGRTGLPAAAGKTMLPSTFRDLAQHRHSNEGRARSADAQDRDVDTDTPSDRLFGVITELAARRHLTSLPSSRLWRLNSFAPIRDPDDVGSGHSVLRRVSYFFEEFFNVYRF